MRHSASMSFKQFIIMCIVILVTLYYCHYYLEFNSDAVDHGHRPSYGDWNCGCYVVAGVDDDGDDNGNCDDDVDE